MRSRARARAISSDYGRLRPVKGLPMKALLLAIAMTVFFAVFGSVYAGTDCTTRKSGSVTITSCSDTKARSFTQCRSYMSGSVRKTSCRS
jgi:hypothetical protein